MSVDTLKFTHASHIDPEIQANPAIVSSIKHSSPIHYHDYFEFFLIIKGKCIHKVNNSEQHLSEGALVFIRPEDVHCYDYDGNSDCAFINIACNKEVIEDAFHYFESTIYIEQLLNVNLPLFTVLSPLEIEDFIRRYEKLKMLCIIDKAKARIQLRSMIIEILTQYFSGNITVDKKNIPLWLESLLIQMQKKENFTVGLEKMYKLSGRSVGHLNRVFKQQFNTTPTSYINHLKLSFAKSLLLSTSLSIVEISLEAGFENLSHFYHMFKKSFNITPSDLRFMQKL